jgi:hypothetical protein
MNSVRVCTKCHEHNKYDARYCCRCGHRLSDAARGEGSGERPQLYLHEAVLLLALDDERGTVHGAGDSYRYAMAGGILAELLLTGRISIDPDRRELVTPRDPRSFHDPILDEALLSIQEAGRRRRLRDWVSKLARTRNLHERVATVLCRRGILEQVEGRILFFFPTKRYPTRDPIPEYSVVDNLRNAILGEAPKVDDRTALLVALADAADLLAVRISRHELRAHKQRISELHEFSDVGPAVRDAIRAVRGAVAAAAAAGAAVAATS